MNPKSIIAINLTRPKNELHVQFHESVITLIQNTGVESLPFGELFARYKSAFGNESEALLLITKSELTAQISEQDRLRDSIFRGFSDTVKGNRNHFDPEIRAAANRLWNIFLHYGNIAQKPLDEETAAINDFLREFKRTEIAAATDRLKMKDWVDRLAQENDKFHQLMMDRYREATAKTTYRMKTARVETDRYYRAIVAAVENQALMDALSPALGNFIIELNAIISRFKSILAQELGRKNSDAAVSG